MPAGKPVTKTLAAKTFTAVLERTQDRLRWVIVRVPLDLAKVWGKRGQIRVLGEINGFAFGSTLFPTGKGEHFLIVNKKMQAGGKTAPGLTAKFHLRPDTAPREVVEQPKEMLRELGQSKRLLKFYESFTPSRKHEIAKWIGQVKSQEARQRRSQQLAERLMETMEAERELPPMIEMAFRQSPKAHSEWQRMSSAHRRAHLLSIFYYRDPASRARRIAKCVQEMLERSEKAGARKGASSLEIDAELE